MPFYEFTCRECGYRFTTKNIPWGEKAGVRCPDCGGADLQEVYGLQVLVGRRARRAVPACDNSACAGSEVGCHGKRCPPEA